MDDLVAVAVGLSTGGKRFFITWGRIQDALDAKPLEALVLRHASQLDLGGRPVRARVCDSLKQARHEPHFYEALFAFARQGVPRGKAFERWKRVMDRRMQLGKELYFLGRRPSRKRQARAARRTKGEG